MDWDLAGHVATVAGGLLYLALAAVLLRHSADRPANVALALLFLVDAASELLFMVARVTGDPTWDRVGIYYGWAQSPFLLAFGAAYLGSSARLPRWTTRLWPYALLTVAISLWLAAESASGRPAYFNSPDDSAFLWSNMLLSVSFALVPLLLARVALRNPGPRAASDVLLATGVALWWASTTGEALARAATVGDRPAAIVAAAIGRALLTAWLVVVFVGAARSRPDLRAVARAGTVAVLGATAIGIASAPAWPIEPALGLASAVTWMVLAPAVVAYAILRHQLLGIDVKVRFAISKSTVAAVFIAVFFVASEAAQQFFGETIGSTYAGIAAAGALVFAIAPLQRAAERLAERAVPTAGASAAAAAGPAAGSSREGAFRDAVRLALRARITREEEFALARLARELGLDPHRALELRDEVERETAEVAR